MSDPNVSDSALADATPWDEVAFTDAEGEERAQGFTDIGDDGDWGDVDWRDLSGPQPDGLDLIVECANLVSTFAADRYRRIDSYRREQHARAQATGFPVSREHVDRSVRLEISAALRITENLAGRWIAMAEALVSRYPAVWQGMSQARIPERHAQLLVDALDDVEPHLAERVLPRAVEWAEELPLGAFRRRLRNALDSERSATLAERVERAVADRNVFVEPARDGMAWLSAHLPAVEAQAIQHRITALAKTLTGDDETRTLDQRRADVFCDLLLDGETASLPAAARGIRPSVTVTVPALTLLGRDTAPGTLDGVGPIPPDVARDLAGAADSWTRVLTHPETGVVLSVGRDRYRPPADLRRLVQWRSSRCMAPGCNIPADRCDLDHTTDWARDGHTAHDNLAPLCRGHHTLKHHTEWSVRSIPDAPGALEWCSPSGRRYRVIPERRVPTFVPAPDPASRDTGRRSSRDSVSGTDPPPF